MRVGWLLMLSACAAPACAAPATSPAAEMVVVEVPELKLDDDDAHLHQPVARALCAPPLRDHRAWGTLSHHVGSCSYHHGRWGWSVTGEPRPSKLFENLGGDPVRVRRLVVVAGLVFELSARVWRERVGCEMFYQECDPDAVPTSEVVARLGDNGGSDELMRWLALSPERGVRLAVDGLEAESDHMWNMCARVFFLEELTGKRFRGRGGDKLMDFCSYVAPAGKLVLSPVQVRRLIVDQWKEFAKRHASTFTPNPKAAFRFFGP